jgi:hypothetical protein
MRKNPKASQGSGIVFTLSAVVGMAATMMAFAGQRAEAQEARVPVQYVNIRQSAGITFLQDATATDEKYYLETGVAWLDYNQDGLMDLYFVQSAATDIYKPPQPLRSTLYQDIGDGTFAEVAAKTGVGYKGGVSASAGWFDYDKDGWLDLLVTNYIEWPPKSNQWCGERRPGYRSYCHPNNSGDDDRRRTTACL